MLKEDFSWSHVITQCDNTLIWNHIHLASSAVCSGSSRIRRADSRSTKRLAALRFSDNSGDRWSACIDEDLDMALLCRTDSTLSELAVWLISAAHSADIWPVLWSSPPGSGRASSGRSSNCTPRPDSSWLGPYRSAQTSPWSAPCTSEWRRAYRRLAAYRPHRPNSERFDVQYVWFDASESASYGIFATFLLYIRFCT